MAAQKFGISPETYFSGVAALVGGAVMAASMVVQFDRAEKLALLGLVVLQNVLGAYVLRKRVSVWQAVSFQFVSATVAALIVMLTLPLLRGLF